MPAAINLQGKSRLRRAISNPRYTTIPSRVITARAPSNPSSSLTRAIIPSLGRVSIIKGEMVACPSPLPIIPPETMACNAQKGCSAVISEGTLKPFMNSRRACHNSRRC